VGPTVNSSPHVSETEQSAGFGRQELADGEVTGDVVSTIEFPITKRIYWYPRLARWIARATSMVVMAATRGGTLVVSGHGKLRRAWLHLYRDLTET
jgi:hypothetical protein